MSFMSRPDFGNHTNAENVHELKEEDSEDDYNEVTIRALCITSSFLLYFHFFNTRDHLYTKMKGIVVRNSKSALEW